MKSLKIGSLFSGIEGFGLAGRRLGLEIAFHCEIDPFCRKVLAKNFPGVPCYEDITQIVPERLPPIDILTGGWPCQDASIAGKRAGLAGERTGLFNEIIRIIEGMDPRPRWVLLENVPGLVSVREGQDFTFCLRELQRLGYAGCVRMLDAQYFSLAQRRRRLFFIGGLGRAGLRAIQLVLEGGKRYPLPRKEARTGSTTPSFVGTLQSGGNGGGWRIGADEAAGNQIVTGSLMGSGAGTARPAGIASEAGFVVAPPLAFRQNARGGVGRMDGESETFVARTLLGKPNSSHQEDRETYVTHTLRAEGFDASEDGTGRGTPIVVQSSEYGVQQYDTAPNLRADRQSGGEYAVLLPFDTTQVTSNKNYSNPQEGDPCHPLAAGGHPPAVAYNWQTGQGYLGVNGERSPTLSRGQVPAVFCRRLTPTEAERLQGFSFRDQQGEWQDGWTCLCGRNNGRSVGKNPCVCADGPRYRACGNAVAVPVVEWILKRILLAEELECDAGE